MKHIVQVYFTTALFAIVWHLPLIGQQTQYNWKIGAAGEVYSYFGDLTNKFRLIQPTEKTIKPLSNINFESYGWSAERSLGAAWTLGLSYDKGVLTANDRQIGWNGELQSDSKNFTRSLNAKTKLKNYNLFLAYYLDNGSFFRKKAKLVPFVKIGAGLTSFSVFGDLYSNEQRYYYWPDGTIRNTEPGSSNSTILTQDGTFETELTKLKTEGKKYKTHVFTPSLGIGLKFRISQKLNLNLEYGAFFTQTDYLDDVASKYPSIYESEFQHYASNPANSTDAQRGNPNGKNDLFTFSSISLQYSFDKKPNEFQAPVIYTGSFLPPPSVSSDEKKEKGGKNESAIKASKQNRGVQAIEEVDSIVEISNFDTIIIVKKVIRDNRSISTFQDSLINQVEIEIPNQNLRDSIVIFSDEIEVIEAGKDTLFRDRVEIINTDSTVLDPLRQTEQEIETDLMKLDSVNDDSLHDSLENHSDTSLKVQERLINIDSTVIVDSAKIEIIMVDSLEIDSAKTDSININIPSKKVESQNIEGKETQSAKNIQKKENENSLKPETNSSDEELTSDLLDEIESLKKDLQNARISIGELKEVKQLTNEDHQALQRMEIMLKKLEASSAKASNEKMQIELKELKAETEGLQNEIRLLAVKNNSDIVEPRKSLNQSITSSDSLAAMYENMEILQAQLDSLRLDKLNKNNVESDSLVSIINGLQAALDSIINVQKKQEIEPQKRKALEIQIQEEQKKQQEIERIQEAASIKQKKLEEERKKMEAELKAKEKLENENNERQKLGIMAEEFGVQSVYFEKGSNEIPKSQMEVIANAVKLMLLHPEFKVEIKGFADPSGPKQINLKLAEQRAETIKESIENFGISEDRIVIPSNGEIDYRANSPQQGRRAQLILILEN